MPENASITDLAGVAQALSSSTRLRILRFVQAEELCVCELAAMLGVTQPAVSQHLAKLREAGLVTERRFGQMALYRSTDVQTRVSAALREFSTQPIAKADLEANADTLAAARERRKELEERSLDGR